MIKLIAFDLDDTLAKLGRGITRTDVRKLLILEQRGITIAVCSGKPVHYLCGFMRQVGLKKPILVGENGAVIQIGVELPPKNLFVQEYSVAARDSMNFLRKKILDAIPQIWFQPNLVGLTPFPSNNEENATIKKILDTYMCNLADIEVYHHDDSYDIVPLGINKKLGLELLCHTLNVIPSEVIAVGDGENDYPMFDYAGLAIGVNVSDISKVNVNFRKLSEALLFLLDYTQ